MQLEWNWIQKNGMKFKFYWIWMNSIEKKWEANRCKRYWNSAGNYDVERIRKFEKSEKKPFYSSLLENQVIQKYDLGNLKLLYLNWVPLIIVLGIWALCCCALQWGSTNKKNINYIYTWLSQNNWNITLNKIYHATTKMLPLLCQEKTKRMPISIFLVCIWTFYFFHE
jgi:hypothetical protein